MTETMNLEKMQYDIEHYFDGKTEEEVQTFFDELAKECGTSFCDTKTLDDTIPKIIFLDIDGVLNSQEFYLRRMANTLLLNEDYPLCEIDPEAIKKLNEIIEITKANVVITSSWRLSINVNNYQEMFIKKGFKGIVLGVTPLLHFLENGEQIIKGCEIAAYLNSNFENQYVKYLIIDSNEDMMLLKQKKHFIQTSEFSGLTFDMIPLAIKMLR